MGEPAGFDPVFNTHIVADRHKRFGSSVDIPGFLVLVPGLIYHLMSKIGKFGMVQFTQNHLFKFDWCSRDFPIASRVRDWEIAATNCKRAFLHFEPLSKFKHLLVGVILLTVAGCAPDRPLPTRAVLIPSLPPAPTATDHRATATPAILGSTSNEITPSGELTATSVPTASPTAVSTMTPTDSPTDTPEPTGPTPTPILLNDIPADSVILLDGETIDHIRQIYATGQDLGRDPQAFSRLGASIVATHHFLGRWDTGPYDLGPYSHLQPVIDYYAGSHSRVGVAAIRGLTALAVFDPTWASEEDCLANEPVIDCEFRLHNPSILLIALGTNDKWDSVGFEKNLRKVVQHTIEAGVIPVLTTKADRFEGEDNRNNLIVRQVAADFRVPLWDFDLIAETLPGRGMGSDDVHLTLFDYYDYNMPGAFETGYGLYNLTALMILEQIWQVVSN